jgi:hypothetical protein
MPTHIFTDLYLKSKRQHFRVFVFKSNLYFISYEIAEFRIIPRQDEKGQS